VRVLFVNRLGRENKNPLPLIQRVLRGVYLAEILRGWFGLKELSIHTAILKARRFSRKLLKKLKTMMPDEEAELVRRRPELSLAVEASHRFWKSFFVGFAAIASLLILVALASALGGVSHRFAVIFCSSTFALLLVLVIALRISGYLTFYSARSKQR